MSNQYGTEEFQEKYPRARETLLFARLADAYSREENLEQAIAVCSKGVSEFPDYIPGHLVMARCLAAMDRLDESRKSYEAALSIDPRCHSALKGLGDILAQMQWSRASAERYQALLEVDPHHSKAKALLERQLHASRDSGESEGFSEGYAVGVSGETEHISPMDEFMPEEEGFSAPGFEDGGGDHITTEMVSPQAEVTQHISRDAVFAREDGQLETGETELEPVSGADIEERLDSLFGEENVEEPEEDAQAEIFSGQDSSEDFASELMTTQQMEIPVEEDSDSITGDDVENRLDDLFGEESPTDDRSQGSLTQDLETDQEEWTPGLSEEVPADATQEAEDTLATEVSPETTEGEAYQDSLSGDDVEERLDSLFGDEDASEAMGSESQDQGLEWTQALGEENEQVETASITQGISEEPETLEEQKAEDEELVTGKEVEERLDSLFPEEESSVTETESPGAASSDTQGIQLEDAFGPDLEQGLTESQMQVLDESELEMGETGFAESFAESQTSEDTDADSEDTNPTDVSDEGIQEELSEKVEASNFESGESDPDGSPLFDTSSLETTDDLESALSTMDSSSVDFHDEAAHESNSGPDLEFEPDVAGTEAENNVSSESQEFVMSPEESALAIPEEPTDEATEFTSDETEPAPSNESEFDSQEVDTETETLDPSAESEDENLGSMDTLTQSVGTDEDEMKIAGSSSMMEELSASHFPKEEDDSVIVDGNDISERIEELFGDESVDLSTDTSEMKVQGFDQPEMDPYQQPGEEAKGTETEDLDPSAGEETGSFSLEDVIDTTMSVDRDTKESETFLMDMEEGEGTIAMTQAMEGTVSQGATQFEDADTSENAEDGLDEYARSDEDRSDEAQSSEAVRESGEVEETTEVVGQETFYNIMGDNAEASEADESLLDDLDERADEEDQDFAGDEELPVQTAPTNVATVTLAEIYFQQGLKEQALQIYRQLLEREPDNEGIRKRMEEIELTRKDEESTGQQEKHLRRRPRPGVKIRKKKR